MSDRALPADAQEMLQVGVEHMRATSPTTRSEDGHWEFALRFAAEGDEGVPVSLECTACGKRLPLLESLL